MLKYSKILPSLTRTIKYTIIPTSCYDILAKPNPIISVAIGNQKGVFCNLNFRNIVPRTAQNYKLLLLGKGAYNQRKLSLIGNGFSKYVKRVYLQLGTMPDGNCSIYGNKFRDESFELLHDRPGLLTSISEQNTNNSRFAITLVPAPFMDLKNIVFGEVTADTFANLRAIQNVQPIQLGLRILSSQLVVDKEEKKDTKKHLPKYANTRWMDNWD